jgi:hypothetical protein
MRLRVPPARGRMEDTAAGGILTKEFGAGDMVCADG